MKLPINMMITNTMAKLTKKMMTKTKLFAATLLVTTTAVVVAYPYYTVTPANAKPTVPVVTLPVAPVPGQAQKIEVVFALDTTSSMSGLIHAAKEKIWSIASTMASAQSAPEIKMGLVAFRDRGDAYVTQVIDLSNDLDSMYAKLMDFNAAGGGDTPESVNQALYDAVHSVAWSQDQDTYKVVFLVGDAPPHMDYQDDVKYPDIIKAAHQKGIVINAIQCGEAHATQQNWQTIAQLGQGAYFQVGQSGSAVALKTPFDKNLADLSRKLDDTRLYYGDAKVKERKQKKLDAADKLHALSSVESRARRATFNASKSGKNNLLGKGELVDEVASGRVDLQEIEKEFLPALMQSMAPAEQQALIVETAQQRKELESQIQALAIQRNTYIKKQLDEQGGASDSLDEKIFSAVRDQAGKKGLSYDAGLATY